MKSLLFSLTGVLAFVLGVLINLQSLLPASVVRAAEPALPFEIEYLGLEQAQVIEGYWAEETFFNVKLRVSNLALETSVFPLGAVIVTNGQDETIALHAGVQAALDAKSGPLFLSPGESRELQICFDVPSTFLRPRLELEASAFSEPEHGLVLGRRVLVGKLP